MTRLLLFFLAATASAQTETPNLDRESQDRSRRGGMESKAAETAAQVQAAGGISFAQVLAAPGDLDLNERFAREQIMRGDLRGAASTLERILILAPGRDRTRLLYAAVLYRLDALQDAERELRIVLGRPAPAEVLEEARGYLALVEGRRRKTHFEARLTTGFGYDDNRNSASDTDKNLFFGVPVSLNANSRAQDDTNVTLSAALGVWREFGGARPQSAFLNIGYYRGEQTRLDRLDLQSYTASAGLALRYRGFLIQPTAGFDHVLLAQSTYLRDPWQNLRVARRVTKTVEAWAETRHEDQRFVRTQLVANARDRSGRQFDFRVGVNLAATPRDRFGFFAGHRRKLAYAVASAYRRESVGGEYIRLLGRGAFFAASLAGQFDRYDRPDVSISSQGRSDDAIVFQMMAGMPLSVLHRSLQGFSATAGLERFDQKSNLLNYEYSNTRLTGFIAYKWGI